MPIGDLADRCGPRVVVRATFLVSFLTTVGFLFIRDFAAFVAVATVDMLAMNANGAADGALLRRVGGEDGGTPPYSALPRTRSRTSASRSAPSAARSRCRSAPGCLPRADRREPAIDWQAAVTALDRGLLPGSSGERHVLRLAASIAAGTPVSLSDALTGIDRRNAILVVEAVAHASALSS